MKKSKFSDEQIAYALPRAPLSSACHSEYVTELTGLTLKCALDGEAYDAADIERRGRVGRIRPDQGPDDRGGLRMLAVVEQGHGARLIERTPCAQR